MTGKPTSIDEYIYVFPEALQTILQQVRTTIKSAAPQAEETISYGIPTFTMNGSYLIYFAGYKNHISLYPAPRKDVMFKDELSAFKGGVGTVQFPIDKPLPLALIRRIVEFRLAENLKKAKP